MRYSTSIVSVLATVDGGHHTHSLEKQTDGAAWDNFSYLIKAPPKKIYFDLSVDYIQTIFIAL